MKKFIVFALLLVTTSAFADLQVRGGVSIQGFAPDSSKSTALTALVSTTVDVSTWTAFSLYCASDSKYRLMPTSAKGSYPLHTIPGGAPFILVVDRTSSKFLNYSGACELSGMK